MRQLTITFPLSLIHLHQLFHCFFYLMHPQAENMWNRKTDNQSLSPLTDLGRITVLVLRIAQTSLGTLLPDYGGIIDR